MRRGPIDESSTRITTFSPYVVGSDDTRTSMTALRCRTERWPSCGTRRSVMSSFAITLMRAIAGPCTHFGTCKLSSRIPFDAIAHDERVRPGLDVDVARLRVEGFEQDQIHHLHDGRLLGLARQRVQLLAIVDFPVASHELDVRRVGNVGEERIQRAFALVDVRDRLEHVRAHRDRGLHTEAGREFHVAERLLVERIRHGDDEEIALQADRHELEAVGHRLVDEVGAAFVEGDGLEVDQRQPKLAAEEGGDFVLRRVAGVLERLDGADSLLGDRALGGSSRGAIDLAPTDEGVQ